MYSFNLFLFKIFVVVLVNYNNPGVFCCPGWQIQSKGQPSHPPIQSFITLKCFTVTVNVFIVYIVLSGEDIVAWIANRFKIDAMGKSST